MNINPEFRRNLWLELTPSRLVGMPLVLGIFFFLAYTLDDKQYGASVSGTALTLFGLLAFLWGTRLASETLISEIRDHTWDSQRMSVIGPWSMTWGKLLGSTIYPWYGALICLFVYLTSQPSLGLSLVETAVLLVGSGFLAQAVGLLSSLQAIRKNQGYGRFQTTIFLVLGATCGLSILRWPFEQAAGITWFGQSYSDEQFVLASLVIFLAWSVFGIYRLLRAELQMKSQPWAWNLFVLFLMVYVAGFLNEGRLTDGQSLQQYRLSGAFLVAISLAYVMVFCERKDPVAFRRLLQYLGRREWIRALESFPLWLSTLPLVALTCLLLVGMDLTSGSTVETGLVAVSALAVVLFLFRDFGIVLFLNLGRIPKRADMLTILFLFMLYGALPTIMTALDLDRLVGFFWPVPGMPAEILLPAALFQAIVMLWLVVRRWRKSLQSSSLS
jgi:hypothetical protein